jgi:hypothetical protein
MSARFDFAISCSPRKVSSSDLQAVLQAIAPFPVITNTSTDCEARQNTPDEKHSRPTREWPRTHL